MTRLDEIQEYMSMDKSWAQIPPIFNRHGQYLVKDFAWFECEHGCFTYKSLARLIKYDLELLKDRPLRDKEAECIKYLIQEKIANKELKKRYFRDRDWKEIRETGRMARKIMLFN